MWKVNRDLVKSETAYWGVNAVCFTTIDLFRSC